MRARLDDSASIEYNDLIGVCDSRKAMTKEC